LLVTEASPASAEPDRVVARRLTTRRRAPRGELERERVAGLACYHCANPVGTTILISLSRR